MFTDKNNFSKRFQLFFILCKKTRDHNNNNSSLLLPPENNVNSKKVMYAAFPQWVSTAENENLYGQAAALGASLVVLSSENSTQAFVNTKLSILDVDSKINESGIYLIFIIIPHSKFCTIYLFR